MRLDHLYSANVDEEKTELAHGQVLHHCREPECPLLTVLLAKKSRRFGSLWGFHLALGSKIAVFSYLTGERAAEYAR